jgi:hypothetical protein
MLMLIKKRIAMKKMVLLMGAVVFLLTSCENDKIDASTEAAMHKSIASVRKSLTSNEALLFDQAIQQIALEGFNLAEMVQGEVYDPTAKLMSAVHGKTAKEIIRERERMKYSK